MTEILEVFAATGPLAQTLQGFAPRPQQQVMAEAVAEAIRSRSTLVCEAGTGTGKTFAYLIPALLSGRKVIVSTGTRNLQDQLFRKDLPLVREAIGHQRPVSLLKGRANYLCVHRLNLALAGPLDAASRVSLARIAVWARHTRSGDIAEVGDLAEEDAAWPRVTSTVDNCLGQECPEWSRCHVVQARRDAVEADLTVVNHHLLLADMSLRDGGDAEVLPSADVFIIDEAHQLPEIAAQFFGDNLTGRQLLDLARDSVAEALSAKAGTEAPRAARNLEHATRQLRLALGDGSRRAPWFKLEAGGPVADALDRILRCLDELRNWLDARSSPTRGTESCLERCRRFHARLSKLIADTSPDGVRWFETRGRGFSLNWTPLDVSAPFSNGMATLNAAWVFTSATLSVDERFEHFGRLLGLQGPTTLALVSPFDYRRNAVLYLPRDIPDPNHPDYTAAVVEASLPVIEASRGGCFMLFTSYRAMHEAEDRLTSRITYPLLLQGSAPRDELLRQFRAHGDAVLLGTSSFWEGVDVRGETLSCVIIDRLPFASPGDPVLAARIDHFRASGGNPFREIQLPAAVIALKQGVGRLIRDVTDRGVMTICDPRLLGRSYGKMFLDSLPPMTTTRDIEDVSNFLTHRRDVTNGAPA